MTDTPLTDDLLATLPTAYGTALGMIERGARVLAVSSGSKMEPVREAGAHVVLDRAKDLAQQIGATALEGIVGSSPAPWASTT